MYEQFMSFIHSENTQLDDIHQYQEHPQEKNIKRKYENSSISYLCKFSNTIYHND